VAHKASRHRRRTTQTHVRRATERR
jgi:hypothetical protein